MKSALCLFIAIGPILMAGWPSGVAVVDIAREDGSAQKAQWFAPPGTNAVPLLVGLHSWSGDYMQKAGQPYAQFAASNGWAFVFPNFRGPNNTPDACGSDLAVTDVLAAVAYARTQRAIASNQVYLVGASGGGHMALLMAARHPNAWAGVSAWVPIVDLPAWHTETKQAGLRYWRMIEAACGGAPGSSPVVDAAYRRRSPKSWLANARLPPLDLNAGIHDGHTGSVPISHSLLAWNLLVPDQRIADEVMDGMLRRRMVPRAADSELADAAYGKKQPLFRRSNDRVRITIFDGGHEILTEAALEWIRRKQAEDSEVADAEAETK